MKQTLRVLAVAAGVIATSSAFAAQDTATMNVQILVDTACAITAVPAPSRTATSGEGVTTQYSGDVEVLCGPGVNYSLTMDSGQNMFGFPHRLAHDGFGNFINYFLHDGIDLYGDNGLSHPSPGRNAVGSGMPQFFPVNLDSDVGMVPAGVYSDTVVVTVTF